MKAEILNFLFPTRRLLRITLPKELGTENILNGPLLNFN